MAYSVQVGQTVRARKHVGTDFDHYAVVVVCHEGILLRPNINNL
jgi:hypothetical protein